MTNPRDSKERREAIQTLAELICDIPVAMLTTVQEAGAMHSRPMVNVNRKFDGDLWFFTLANDPKVIEITNKPQVNVCFSAPSRHQYVSVAGDAAVVKDSKLAELLWTDACDTWFHSDINMKQLSLIQVTVQSAEYWDSKKSTMVALGGLVRRILTGDPTRPVEHDKVEWD